MDLNSILDETDDVQVAWTKFQDAFLETMEKIYGFLKAKFVRRKAFPGLPRT